MPARFRRCTPRLVFALGTLVATLERDGVIVPDPRTGGPSFVRSGVAYLGTDFGREALAVPGQPE
jgi:hypothetical protein